ncbi:hypothetical protein [Dyadobacter bucti]|uniref:hypothetical protein n=1 Tax=Dyadobacter bucti TaxID=2572203 RepID=UPI003F6FD4DB
MVKNSGGNWSISQTFYTNCGSCRTGAEELAQSTEEELGITTKAYPVPFDKDLTIKFSIPSESMVRLELIDGNGTVLGKLADNIHARGYL